LEKVGFDIRIAASAAGNGLSFTAGVFDLDYNELDSASVSALDFISFSDTSDSNVVKKILFSDFESTLNHDNLAGFVANEHVDHSTVEIQTAADSGLSGGGDITATRSLAVDITGTTVAAEVTELDEVLIYDVSATARRKTTVGDILALAGNGFQLSEELVAGESFAANTTHVVRWAIDGETAERVYKTDSDASSSARNFYAIGVIEGNGFAGAVAGDIVNVVLQGVITLGSSDTPFVSADLGKAVHLDGVGTFNAVSNITYTPGASKASYRIGSVRSTTKIQVGNGQLNGIS